MHFALRTGRKGMIRGKVADILDKIMRQNKQTETMSDSS